MSRLTAVLVLAAGLAAAGCNQLFPSPTEPSPTPSGDAVGYTAIGASDAIGYGGTVVCAPLDLGCENGTGYVQEIRRRLGQTGKTVTFLNLGIPGSVLSQAIVTLGASIGRTLPGNFMDQARFTPPTTTVVTVFAGGNDANTIAQALQAGKGGADPRAFADQQIRQWGDDYAALIATVRGRAPAARLVLLNLPNLAGAPYVAGNTVAERSVLQYIAVGLADRTNALAGAGVAVVDLLCTSAIYDPGNFASDGFHPNDRGYQVMADLAWPVVNGGTAPAPLASCPQRTIVPAY
ncbi:MAG: SGNH/GDSL hydrolase family protein [Vicinamibacterales bacterium]